MIEKAYQHRELDENYFLLLNVSEEESEERINMILLVFSLILWTFFSIHIVRVHMLMPKKPMEVIYNGSITIGKQKIEGTDRNIFKTLNYFLKHT